MLDFAFAPTSPAFPSSPPGSRSLPPRHFQSLSPSLSLSPASLIPQQRAEHVHQEWGCFLVGWAGHALTGNARKVIRVTWSMPPALGPTPKPREKPGSQGSGAKWICGWIHVLEGEESTCVLFRLVTPELRSLGWVQIWRLMSPRLYLFFFRWMKLGPIIQSEVSQKDKDHYNILTHIYGI